MQSDEFNERASRLEATTMDPMVQAVVLLARTVNEVNWSMTFLKKYIQAQNGEIKALRRAVEGIEATEGYDVEGE